MNASEFSRQILAEAKVPAHEWEQFIAKFSEVSCAKGEILLSPGANAEHVYLVESGVVRNYFIDSKGNEWTKIFRGPGGLIGPYAEILEGTTSRYYIQATTKAKLWRFAYADFQSACMQGDRAWDRLGRKIAEDNYLEKEKREWELIHLPAGERYTSFLTTFGELTGQIPQYQVASYLGISPEALNRIISTSRKP